MVEDNRPMVEPVAPDRPAGLGLQSVAMLVGLLASRGLGFVRDVIIAQRFGATTATDAYLVAAQIPLVANSLLAGPALHNALMPVAARENAGDPSPVRLKRLVWNVTTLVLAINTAAAFILAIAVDWLMPFFAGGFAPEARQLTSQLTALTLIGLPFIALTHVNWAILNSRGRFWGPALSLSLSNIIIILLALTLGPRLGITAIAVGYSLGLVCQVMVQYAELGRLGLLRVDRVNWRDPDVRAVAQQFVPLALGQLLIVLSPTVDNAIASFLPPGGVTVIRYAQGVIVPISLVSMAVAVPALPRLSRAVAQGDLQPVAVLLQRVVRFLSLVLFGALVWIFVAREPLVGLLYQRGAFDAAAARQTASTLAVYALSIPFAGIYYFLLRGLVAFSAARAILVLNLVALALNVVLDLLFLPLLAHAGIALSSVGVQITYVVVTGWILQRKLKDQRFVQELWRPVLANGIAAALAILVAAAMGSWAARFVPLDHPLLGFLAAFLAAGLYVVLSRLFGACDLDWLASLPLPRRGAAVLGKRGVRWAAPTKRE